MTPTVHDGLVAAASREPRARPAVPPPMMRKSKACLAKSWAETRHGVRGGEGGADTAGAAGAVFEAVFDLVFDVAFDVVLDLVVAAGAVPPLDFVAVVFIVVARGVADFNPLFFQQ
ncbi:hypothetical protein OCS_01297 [Ophiocordyceps sinensis CO18]|uniref:Uncharacterized protein n=1 Tax=Ophiocordyceps sinensis (strain Co18 / CGMCC 3.14243) TaxID=911162 RepID=T5AMD6_OPHSC|nr:hypothetical protein OCS_01297 [Ophiocordyceps sinensis CO18]